MVTQRRLPTRPPIYDDCTCLWQESTTVNPLDAVSGPADVALRLGHAIGIVDDAPLRAKTDAPHEYISGSYPPDKTPQPLLNAVVPRATLFEQDLRPASTTLVDDSSTLPGSRERQRHAPSARYETKSSKLKQKFVGDNKALADRPVPDLLVRRVKKNIRKSSEHKLRELVSYKAELLNYMRALVPKHTETKMLEQAESTSKRSDFGQTWLCHSCLTRLTTYLYYSPTARSPYLYEHAVPAYLSLLDDARAAVNCDAEMEGITHHELSSILHAELSVVEWRLSLKLARFHRKTGYLGVFPMEVGDYADLEIKRTLNQPEDGLLTVIWKKIKKIGE